MATAITTLTSSSTSSVIQEAFDKAGERRIVIFSPGIYKIRRQIRVKSNTHVIMHGAILQRYGAIQSVFLTDASANTTGYNGAHDITFEGGTIEGMGAFTGDNLVTIFHSKDIVFNYVEFRDTVECHGLEINSSLNVTVNHCEFDGYKENPDAKFREAIQIDFAGFSEFVLSGTTTFSKCYDLTCCKNIEILYCTCNKSASRPAPNIFLGSHSQPYGASAYHENITIDHCTITGNPTTTQPGINLNHMKDVVVSNNTINGFARGLQAVAYDNSKTKGGSKVNPKATDGIVTNALIYNNNFNDPTGTYAGKGIFIQTKNGGRMKDIFVVNNRHNNKIVKDYVEWIENVDTILVANNEIGDGIIRLKNCTQSHSNANVSSEE